MSAWGLFLAIGAATYLMRGSFILFLSRSAESDRFETLRRFVPVAALTALIVPALLPAEQAPLPVDRWLAMAAAVFVAHRTKNVLATVASGLAVLWLARLLV